MIGFVNKLKGCLILLLLVAHASYEEERTSLDGLLNPLLRMLKSNIGNLIHNVVRSRQNRELLLKVQKARKPFDLEFPCDVKHMKLRSDKVPNSVHALRPGDIDVVGAMGDSLTAGIGISAATVLQLVFSEERGRSWSIGGESDWRTFLTLPNILKEFNPKLVGFSLNGSQSFQWESQFNVAENGAISKNIPFMVKELVKRIKYDRRVDLKRHWKMVTLLIGDNDFCSEICFVSNPFSLIENHRRDLVFVLRYLRDNLPRTIVNVVPPPRVSEFYDLKKDPPSNCALSQSFLCPCAVGLVHRKKRKIIEDVMIKWQLVDIEVGNMPEFDLDEFTVIPHNYTLNYKFPTLDGGTKLDFGLLAPDCFHFSERGQGRFAYNLWDSLMEPFGRKSLMGTDSFSNFKCPTEKNPYIFTRRNS